MILRIIGCDDIEDYWMEVERITLYERDRHIILHIWTVAMGNTYNCSAATIKEAIPYSGFYLRGPNFCEICEVLTSSQILILKLLFYFCEPATEHVILCRYPSTYGMYPTAVVPLHVATARDHGDFMCHGDKPALLGLLHLTLHTSS